MANTERARGAAVRIRVDPDDAGQRLDQLLAASGAVVSRAQAQALVRAGRVLVGGAPKKASYVVRSGDVVQATVDPGSDSGKGASAPAPEAVPLSVLYEDETVLVVDKAPGMVVHPAPGHRGGTLVNAILHHLQHLGEGFESGDPQRPGIVHRLDKDTSGVVIVAKTALAHVRLSGQFRDRTVMKRYLAVVRGRMPAPQGSIDQPIGRHRTDRQRMSVRARHGRAAITRYVVVGDYETASILHLFPTTGRTHQLRVHLASTGHPIVGDRVYGRLRARNRATDGALDEVLSKFPRQALHAERLEFTHPASGTRVAVEAPVPPDLELLTRRLAEKGSGGERGLGAFRDDEAAGSA